MILDSRDRYEARAGILKALAHPSRLRIVEELGRGERCVGDLTEIVGLEGSTVSRHLAVLKGACIVKDEKRGAKVFYSLKAPRIADLFDWIETMIECVARERLRLVR